MTVWVCQQCPARCVLITRELPGECLPCSKSNNSPEWREARFQKEVLNEERINGAIDNPWESFMEELP